MGEREKTCAERIGDQLTSRLEWFTELSDAVTQASESDDSDAIDDAYQTIYESPLAISTRKVIRVELSTGGPGDWLEYQVDPEDNACERITYHFQDWFDHAERTLDGDEYDTAYAYADTLGVFEQ